MADDAQYADTVERSQRFNHTFAALNSGGMIGIIDQDFARYANGVLTVFVNIDHQGGDRNTCGYSREYKHADDKFSLHVCTRRISCSGVRGTKPVVSHPGSSTRSRSAPT